MTDDLPPRLDIVEGAHLTSDTASARIDRYRAPEDLDDLLRRFWIPTWHLPDGEVQEHRVLQYPTCLIVVTDHYARFQGVATGMSTVELADRGWAFGVMLQPAAGRLLWSAPMEELTDGHVDLATVPGLDGATLADGIREAMAADPTTRDSHARAVGRVAAQLREHLPVSDDARLVNRLVEHVESSPGLTRVDELASTFAMDERTLQRLTATWLGLTPKWLIQRRRLHDAVRALKLGGTTLATLAHDLGYTDQAHFTRDFSRATGTSPGRYRAGRPGA